mmetsp:Transcript_14654/g.22112  ORF Transcript_14654/g.22112 Transcript_14654/m.22112 type:complete len:231 (-) Transcript_14654:54-746(-)
MQYRHMTKSSSFSDWVNKKNNQPEQLSGEDIDESASLLGQIYGIQDHFSLQMQELSGSLPGAGSGPLSQAFRNRMKYSIYLLLGSILFAVLGIVVGLPTIVLRPSKFVLCITLSTLMAVASVIVIQTPTVFVDSLLKSGKDRIASVVGVVFSSLVTIYVTVFVKRYVVTIAFAAIQILCILWFIASFIPGGSKGLEILLRTSLAFLKTLLTPCLYVCSKGIKSLISTLMS